MKEFDPVFPGQGFGFGLEGGLSGFVEFGRRGCSSGYGDAYFHEEFFLACRRADAEQAGWASGCVMELVWSVGGDVDGFACADCGSGAPEGGLEFAFEQGKGFLKIVAVGRWAAAGRDVHVDQAEAACGVLASKQDGVSVAYQADVRQVVRLSEGESSLGIIRREV